MPSGECPGKSRQFSWWDCFTKDTSNNTCLEGFLISAKICKVFFFIPRPRFLLTSLDLVPAIPPTFPNFNDLKL